MNPDLSLVDWSRAQFALTAMYHWLFVPLTLGLGLIMAIVETAYYRTGDEQWKHFAKFWQRLFGINFAIGVATGIILEFQFGTNWSNYSWFVGDIFGAPLAIEGIFAFFMEATFIAVMFFGWGKVSKGFHLTSTWLTWVGASLSALWILVAGAWMQNPVGMEFNPDTVRHEMISFAEVVSPRAINKFLHTTMSGWVVGAAFVIGVCCWYLIKGREHELAKRSIPIAAIVGLVATLLVAFTGDKSAVFVAERQPMKLAAMEGLYEGQTNCPLIAIGVLNPAKKNINDGIDPFIFKFEIPNALSLLSFRQSDAYIPGIKNIIEGGYLPHNGTTPTESIDSRIESGKLAIAALREYKVAKKDGDTLKADAANLLLKANFNNFGYGYLAKAEQAIPPIALTFYSFHLMVILGFYFILFFILIYWLNQKGKLQNMKWLLWIGVWSVPLAYLTTQFGWIVSEVGRQPWVIQDLLPTYAAVSSVSVKSVQTTFFIFLALFTVLLIAELKIMFSQIRKGVHH